MIETSMICILMANISFWICLFIDGFALGSLRLNISYLAFIPFIIGWVFFFASSPSIIDSFTSATLSDWSAIAVLITAVLITSLGGGFFSGRLFREDKNDI